MAGMTGMTGRERLAAALAHREPDTVPIFECVYSRPLFQEVLGYVPGFFDPPSVFKCYEKIGYDFAFMPVPGVSGFRPEGASGEYTDEWGIAYREDPSTWPMDGAVKAPLATAGDWKNYRVPDAAAGWRWKGFREVVGMSRENGMGVVGNVRGPYSGSWMLFGMDAFSLLLYDEPQLVDSVLAAITDYAIKSFGVMAREGADAILISDDYGSITQTLFSPEHFRRHFVPQLRRMANAAKKLGLPLLLHSDGHVRPFVGDAAGLGIQGLHPIERAAGMELAEIKRVFGKTLCLFGNVDNKDLLVNGAPGDVERQVRECIAEAGRGGGYCLGSDHSVHDDIPNRNVFALYEAGRRHGRYPLAAPGA
ncbi:MAG: hypothetical protein LBJ10_02130 [Clostridiales bacterium]|jgi:uroporphyrinogen decarboxylase|nr:hypothetical protein [Clostridiales bacterium]